MKLVSINKPIKKKKKKIIRIRLNKLGIDFNIELITSLSPLFFEMIRSGLRILTNLTILNIPKFDIPLLTYPKNQIITREKSRKLHPLLKYEPGPLNNKPYAAIFSRDSTQKDIDII